MNRLGTDVLALACIVGGAGLSVAASLALADDSVRQAVDADVAASSDCSVEVSDFEVRADDPVVVALQTPSERVVVKREIRIRTKECLEDQERVHIQVGAQEARERAREARERAREARERARGEVERARDRIERARVRIERIDRIDLDELRDLEIDFELDENLESEIEERLEDALRQLEERLERLDDEVGT